MSLEEAEQFDLKSSGCIMQILLAYVGKKAMHMFFHCSNVVYSFIATKESVRKQRWGGGERKSLCQGSVFQFSFDKAIHEQVTAEKTKNKYYMRKLSLTSSSLSIHFSKMHIFPSS